MMNYKITLVSLLKLYFELISVNVMCYEIWSVCILKNKQKKAFNIFCPCRLLQVDVIMVRSHGDY